MLPPPTPMPNSPAPILPCISRGMAYEGYIEMPGKMRGETRALRNASRGYAHRHGLPLDHAAMVPMLKNSKVINEIARQHGVSPDLPTAHTSDQPTTNNVPGVEKSTHADIWQHSTMHQEFNDLLHADTFARTRRSNQSQM